MATVATPGRRYGLSKSKIASFEQCPKRLWLQVHRPEEAEISALTQAAFAAGNDVAAIACEAFPDGIMIEADPDLAAALRKTAELIALQPPRPLFEATFERDRVLVRVDLMIPAGDGRWHIAEVKSSTSAKPQHLSDLATQIWVLQGNGVEVASASIRHINNQFIYPGDRCYDGLLLDALSDELIAPIIVTRAEVAAAALAMLEGDEPEQSMGDQCSSPYECEFQGYCRRRLALPLWPISILPNSGSRLAKRWAEFGIYELTDLAEADLANPLHQRIHRATASGEPFHDVDGAVAATRDWTRPLSYLDFETIAFAVPRWVGTKPYQQVPFQYSLHIEYPSGELAHREFLDLTGDDPRRACAEALAKDVPETGAVIAYNASFERAQLRQLADEFSDLAPALLNIAERMVDLLPVAKANWYHPAQRGSWSIKQVLPTIAPEYSYETLEVGDGGAAQLAYAEATSAGASSDRRAQIDAALRAYCGLDTLAMVAVHRRLTGQPAPALQKLTGDVGIDGAGSGHQRAESQEATGFVRRLLHSIQRKLSAFRG